MSFLLRILFSGLIAFVPSQDGKEMTVLLLNVNHHYHTSDGRPLAKHVPVLVARAGGCSGNCSADDSAVARYLFSDQSTTAGMASVQTARADGGVWLLSGSDLSLAKGSSSDPDLPDLNIVTTARGTVSGQPQTLPTTSAEREDYSWVANLKTLCPTCTLNPDVLGSTPPAGLIAARFKLRSGKIFTYAVARHGSNVTPVYFQSLDGLGSVSSYSQAVATWVGADITVSGENIELVEEKFNGDAGRSMTLSPDENGKIEMAVLNLPPFVPPTTHGIAAPEVGRHVEAYYDLLSNPPAQEERLVPRPGAASGVPAYTAVDWSSVHPSTTVWSPLLNAIRLDIGRGPYDKVLCPPFGYGP